MKNSIIFIVVDSLRKDFTLQNSKGFKSFADNGVFFDQLITHAPETFLSIGTHLTGIYPFKHRAGYKPIKNVLTMFDYLRPTHKLFTVAYHPPFGGSFNDSEYERDFGYIGKEQSRKLMWTNPDVSKIIEFLNNNKNNNVFVFAHFFTLRGIEKILCNSIDYLCEKGNIDEVMRGYREAVSRVDIQIHRLFECIKNRLEDYLFVITSDHGESFKLFDNHILGDTGIAWILHNGCRYDESINIPMILCGMDVPNGRVIKKQIRQIDVFPTIADILKLKLSSQIDGVSVKLDDELITETPVFIGRTSETFKRAVRMPEQNRFKFKLIYDNSSVELFDLSDDLKEQHNLSELMPKKTEELLSMCSEFFSKEEIDNRDIISKHSGWERLDDNWSTLKKRFNFFNIDEWRHKADKYDSILGVSSLQYITDLINMMYLNSSTTVLDVGVGTGAVSKHILDYTKNVYGVDISPSMLALTHKDIKTYIGFAEKLPFKDGMFEVVFGRQIYHNLDKHLEDAVKEAKRVLKPGGRFLIAEFIPPNDDLIEEWISLRINKEKRSLINIDDIINLLSKHDFKIVDTFRNAIRRSSLNNWLENWCESEELKNEMESKFVSASDEYKKAANFEISGNDLLFDMHYGIVCGMKEGQ